MPLPLTTRASSYHVADTRFEYLEYLRSHLLSIVIWEPTTSHWMKQSTWPRTVLCGGWCLRMALCTPSGACQKRRRRCPCWWQLVHSDYEQDARVLLNRVTYIVSILSPGLSSAIIVLCCWNRFRFKKLASGRGKVGKSWLAGTSAASWCRRSPWWSTWKGAWSVGRSQRWTALWRHCRSVSVCRLWYVDVWPCVYLWLLFIICYWTFCVLTPLLVG